MKDWIPALVWIYVWFALGCGIGSTEDDEKHPIGWIISCLVMWPVVVGYAIGRQSISTKKENV